MTQHEVYTIQCKYLNLHHFECSQLLPYLRDRQLILHVLHNLLHVAMYDHSEQRDINDKICDIISTQTYHKQLHIIVYSIKDT